MKLRLVMGHAGRFEALVDGRVQVKGVELETSIKPFNDLFRLVPQLDDFDVAELSTTAYLWGVHTGRDWIALPVFTGWAVAAHADTVCHAGAGIESPRDLKGKRIGVPEYPVAAILWIRDALESKYGLRPQDLQWSEQRQPEQSHYRLMGYSPPKDVPVRIIPKDRTLSDMLIAGELDAVIRYLPAKPGQMSLEALAAQPQVKWLYADRKAEAIEHCRQQGFFEPIHYIIMRRSIAEAHPSLPMRLVDAFREALRLSDASETEPDVSPIGVRANRKAIDRLLELAQRQGFTPGRTLPIDRLFHPSTLDT